MPRPGTIAADIEHYLKAKRDGARIGEIASELANVRRSPVLRHSVRSALYQNLEGSGHELFTRLERGVYGLKAD